MFTTKRRQRQKKKISSKYTKMMLSGGGIAATGSTNVYVAKRNAKSAMGMSKMGISTRKRNADPSQKHNIDKIRDQSSRTLPEEFHYKPKVSESFLENWLDFPVDRKVSVLLNSWKMWLTWLVWTSKGMAGLDPGDTSIRSRVCSQLSVLGTAAGLFLVIAIAGFLVPPELKHEHDKFWLDVYGCMMFTASVCLLFYIGVSLTGTYPLIESLRDDIAFDAYENYQTRVGGYEAYLFFFGLQIVLMSLLVAAKILYSDIALFVMLGVTVLLSGVVLYLSRQIFLSLDPISSMHMGLSNDPEDQYRAELLSHFILRKIPNSIVEEAAGEDVFTHKNESQKYEHTKSKKAAEDKAQDVKRLADDYGDEGFASSDVVQAAHRRGSGTERTEWWAHAKVADAGAEMEVVDLESTKVPFVAISKPVSEGGTGATSGPANDLAAETTSLMSAVTPLRRRLPPLREIFCDVDKYWLRSEGVPIAESVEAYETLLLHRCKTAEELVAYLDDHKELRACTCGAELIGAGGSGPPHRAHCHTRQVGAWTGALRELKVPGFTARKIVTRIKNLLQ